MPKIKKHRTKASSKKGVHADTKYLFFISLLIASGVLFLSFVNLFPRTAEPLEKSVLAAKHESLNQAKVYWEKFLQENPEYLDGWLEIAKIYSEIGYVNGAIEALGAAKEIDPNSEKIIQTKVLLGL